VTREQAASLDFEAIEQRYSTWEGETLKFGQLVDQEFLRKKLDKILSDDPDNEQAKRKRADWYARQGRWDDAARDYHTVLERLPDDDGIHSDRSLLLGSALFGAGWGMAGYCPGPALTAAAVGFIEPLVFLVALLAGSLLFDLYRRKSS
jgi:tetratricopeptide (TPR) repeat protein